MKVGIESPKMLTDETIIEIWTKTLEMLYRMYCYGIIHKQNSQERQPKAKGDECPLFLKEILQTCFASHVISLQFVSSRNMFGISVMLWIAV